MFFKLGANVSIASATPVARGIVVEDGPAGPRVYNCNTKHLVYVSRENLSPIPEEVAMLPTVAVLVEEGAVCGVRSDVPVAVTIVDLDNLAQCSGGATGPCSPDELRVERIEHQRIRASRRLYDALPIAVSLND